MIGDRPLLDETDGRLRRAAAAVREKAYAPYSGFRVGAALLGADGAVHVGANVENAAYPQGQCAEASAIGAMVAAGCTRIERIWIVAESAGEAVAPCGGCRQRLREFAVGDLGIGMSGPAGEHPVIVTLGDLLPMDFGPAQLGR